MKKIMVLLVFLSLFATLAVSTATSANTNIAVKVGIYENQPQVFTLANADPIQYQSLTAGPGALPAETNKFPDWLKWLLIGIGSSVALGGSGTVIFRDQVKRKTKELERDIAVRKDTEKALRTSEEKYRLTLDSMMEGCQIIDTDFRYIYLNDTAVKHSRRTREKLLGKTMMEVYPGIENTEMFTYLRRCMADRAPHRMENKFADTDAIEGWFDLSIEPVPEGVFVLSIDITERKQVEKALRESEEMLRDIYETVPEGIVITGMDGVIRSANPAAVSMHGYATKDEIIGRKDIALIAEKDRENASKNLQDVLTLGITTHVLYTLIRKDGSEFPGEISAAVMKNAQGNPIGIIAVTADATARTEALEEHQKIIEYRELDRLKTSLLSTVSHELRTPLASIKGYASLLRMYDQKLNKEQKNESVEAIDRSTDRLTELIDHLLDMSRLDAGLLRLTLQPVKPREILLAAIDEAKLRSPKYKFNNEVKGRLPEVLADGRRLRQIIDNILENAVKYSPEHTEITLKAEVKPEGLLVSVSDHGRGIPEEEYHKIFERMYRIEQRLQKDPGGLGLGLSLCKALVEGHGGRIWVESVVDQGSTFYFTIPLKNGDKGNNHESKPDEVKESTRH